METYQNNILLIFQSLLRLFGIPYITAPMEAEAQCVFLEKIGFTEGTVTDDSDVWLFGANVVYKDFFDSHKYVKQFKSIDIKQKFGNTLIIIQHILLIIYLMCITY